MSNADIKANRPLSPHLSIYRWRITMAMSIFHRITGGAIYFGLVILVWWLAAAAAGPGPLDLANAVLSSWFGMLVLFGLSWAYIHHALGGIRHYVWDFGLAMGRPQRDQIALATIVGSVVLTLVLWAIILAVKP
jgi:succinate dehydrogenase / fumarate reductase cytochrome b subunit